MKTAFGLLMGGIVFILGLWVIGVVLTFMVMPIAGMIYGLLFEW